MTCPECHADLSRSGHKMSCHATWRASRDRQDQDVRAALAPGMADDPLAKPRPMTAAWLERALWDCPAARSAVCRLPFVEGCHAPPAIVRRLVNCRQVRTACLVAEFEIWRAEALEDAPALAAETGASAEEIAAFVEAAELPSAPV